MPSGPVLLPSSSSFPACFFPGPLLLPPRPAFRPSRHPTSPSYTKTGLLVYEPPFSVHSYTESALLVYENLIFSVEKSGET